MFIFLPRFAKFLGIINLNILSVRLSFCSDSGIPIMLIVSSHVCLIIPAGFLHSFFLFAPLTGYFPRSVLQVADPVWANYSSVQLWFLVFFSTLGFLLLFDVKVLILFMHCFPNFILLSMFFEVHKTLR